MSFGGGSGGSGKIATSQDVALNNPLEGDLLTYDGTLAKWKNAVAPGGAAGSLDWINVKSAPYNAAGNGSTDDTTAINNAIAAALSGTYKRAVFFPAGRYKMTSGITMQSSLTLLGEGLHEKEFERRSTIVNTTTDTFVWGGTGATDSSQRPKDMVIRGLCFSGSNPNTNFLTPTSTSASGAYPQHLVIEECGIHNYATIISGAVQALYLRQCYLNNTSAGALNLGGSDSFIEDNFMDGYIAGSPSTAALVTLSMEQTVFSGNYLTASPNMGLKIGNYTQGLRVSNNIVNGLAQTASHGGGNYTDGPGIYVGPGAGGVIISGNTIGNTCNNPNGNHIRISQVSGTVNNIKVQGNNYTNGSSGGNILSIAPIITVTGTTTNIFLDEWGSVIKTKAGAPTDADFVTTPPNGTLAVDTTNNRLYVRVGGTWKYSSLT
jgi:hypothetical protein